MNRKQQFNQLKYWKFEYPEQKPGIYFSASKTAFLIRLTGLLQFREALEELRKVDLLLEEDYPGNKLRFNWEKKFWTLPVNEVTAKFLDYWSKEFCIPVKLD